MTKAQIDTLLELFTSIVTNSAANGRSQANATTQIANALAAIGQTGSDLGPGAIEQHGIAIVTAGDQIAHGLCEVARAIERVADAIGADGEKAAPEPNESPVDARGGPMVDGRKHPWISK